MRETGWLTVRSQYCIGPLLLGLGVEVVRLYKDVVFPNDSLISTGIEHKASRIGRRNKGWRVAGNFLRSKEKKPTHPSLHSLLGTLLKIKRAWTPLVTDSFSFNTYEHVLPGWPGVAMILQFHLYKNLHLQVHEKPASISPEQNG